MLLVSVVCHVFFKFCIDINETFITGKYEGKKCIVEGGGGETTHNFGVTITI